MKRTTWMMPAMFLVGCSTSPCADFLDHFWPAKPPASAAGSYGGVCNPVPTGPGVAGGPVAPGTPPPLTTIPMTTVPGNAPVVVPPPTGGTVPNQGPPYIPGQPPAGTGSPPPLMSFPPNDVNGTPTSSVSQPGGADSRPLPPPPSSSAPPLQP